MTELSKDDSERNEVSGLGPEASSGEKPSSSTKAMVQAVRLQFSGPLPPPNVLAQYNDALPDGAERVVKMTEDQAEHRRQMEARGQIFAFVLAAIALIGGIVLIALGDSAAGLVPLIGAIGGLAGLFVYREVKSHRTEKALLDA